MTHMFRKQSTNMINSTTSTRTPPTNSGVLGMHSNSRAISKVQPKIRIIHIFAPEIIKTDVANFRELVQRLTGKPSLDNDSRGKGKGKCKGKKVKLSNHDDDDASHGAGTLSLCNKSHVINTKLEVMGMSGSSSSPSSSSDLHTSHDHHQEGWRSTADDHNSTSGWYLSGFNDLDYNFDFNTMFHLGAADGSSHLNSLGESQLSYRG